jgi:hypothetical protein
VPDAASAQCTVYTYRLGWALLVHLAFVSHIPSNPRSIFSCREGDYLEIIKYGRSWWDRLELIPTLRNAHTLAGTAAEVEHLLLRKKEHDAWDVYNTEAKKQDTELVNDWRNSLNSLLLFVSYILLLHNLYLTCTQGGHFCCRSHRVRHRKQEKARGRPDRDSRRSRWLLSPEYWKSIPCVLLSTQIRAQFG